MTFAPIVENVAQLSNRPSFARSCAPVATTVPREPTTFAETIRGETPRLVTLIARSFPWTRPPSLRCACASVNVAVHRCFGEVSSYGSSTERRYGWGVEPGKPFSTFSVFPPEVEKKYVTIGLPR